MNWVQAAFWGIAGGFVIEGLELHGAFRVQHCWPWKVDDPTHRAGPLAYIIVELVRMCVGGVVAAAAAASGQVSGPLAALALGVATPTVVERLAALIPLSAKPENSGEQ